MPADLAELPTPVLLLDRDRLERNTQRMTAHAQALGVSLRPHLKTAKSADVARILTRGWSGASMVSTLAEAEYFVSHGFEDIIYGVVIDPFKFERAARIGEKAQLGVLVDSVEIAEALAAFARETRARLDVHIEIDCDGHRGGVAPESATLIDIARVFAEHPSLTFQGVLTHAGEAYEARGPNALEQCAADERDAIIRAAARLAEAGIACSSISLGSTPTATFARDLAGVTELRAGVYAFGDLVQAELGSCGLDDIAISVMATVIGHQAESGRVIVDAGWMALSGDRGTASFPRDWHYGAVADGATGAVHPDVTVRHANQEHGIIEARSGRLDVARFPLGSRLRILPNHACATAAAYDRYIVHSGSKVLATWTRANGW